MLEKAFKSNCVSIAIRVTSTVLNGDDVIAITNSKLGRLMKEYEAKNGMTIKRSRTQLAYNMKIDGEFFPMLCIIIREVVCVRLKLMIEGYT